ncbi:MAG: hypothetical protein AMQ22_00549 [Candidatus Methanofastidiosum methylothiophilum]|uniref:Right handed beta helix domain-containing protein n=1 Tax=Candidatus Methanofastidiosum methylothiophilum TaxID=1705564 RepID=A0A150J7B7_9EURY|nr:MAG: hypothetical protein AMQ22_00549 [Candidatus Methanofastidiosum methylthiophilus]
MNKIKSVIIMSILLASIFIVLSPVSAATYHVYPGDDIRAIIQGATSGDTIYVHAGTYNIVNTISIPADHITIIGDDPLTTILDASGISGGDVITTSGHNYLIIRNITVQNNPDDDGIEVEEYCEVTNCIIKNCDDGIVYDTEGHHNTIQNCIVSNCRDDGIQVYDYNTIENCISFGNGEDGFDMGENSTIKNCLAYDNDESGFYDGEDCTYINCTAANNGDDGFYSDDGGAKIINCIAVGNNKDGFDIQPDGSEILYSNAWNNTGNNYDEAPAGTGSISVDPFFMKGPLGDFYLFKSSPCVNKGSDSAINLGLSTGFTTNVKGAFDTGTVDMGYHYSSNGGSDSSLPIAKILEILKGNQEG